jgi:hypothetical protein
MIELSCAPELLHIIPYIHERATQIVMVIPIVSYTIRRYDTRNCFAGADQSIIAHNSE